MEYIILSRYTLLRTFLLLNFYDNVSIFIHIDIFFHVHHSIFHSFELTLRNVLKTAL